MKLSYFKFDNLKQDWNSIGTRGDMDMALSLNQSYSIKIEENRLASDATARRKEEEKLHAEAIAMSVEDVERLATEASVRRVERQTVEAL